MQVREAALLSLERCEKSGKYSNLEVDSAIKKYGFTGHDRAFFTALVYGVIERRITLDYFLAAFSSLPLEKIEARVAMILRLGLYQLLFLDSIPDRAAVNESVELAKLHTHKGTAGFVNAVLRQAVRQKEHLPYPEKDSLSYDSVYYACPTWLCAMWRDMYGEEKSRAILGAINRNPHITLRVNRLKTDRERLMARLTDEGIFCRASSLSQDGILLDEYTPVSLLTPLAEGLCIVQDEASQLAADAVGARPGETVIDTCSCPGGKSFGMAMGMENRGRLLSLDLHENKLSLVKSGAERLGISIIETAVQNGTKRREEWRELADRVLCDVPCSGLGVIAKKPDLRHKSPTEIEGLPEIQYQILCNGAYYVKPGGTLVYSTCTLNKKENEEIVTRFLKEHPSFLPSAEGMPLGRTFMTFFPDETATDGFFLARFVKKNDESKA